MDTGTADFDITLRDGRAVHIRAMRATDEAEFLQGFARLSPDARHMRFMRAGREPNPALFRKVLASKGGYAAQIRVCATAPLSR